MKRTFFKRLGALALTSSLLFVSPGAHAKAVSTARDAQRIHFARGHENRTVEVTLTQHRSSVSYLVGVRAGQSMSIQVTPRTRHEGVVPTLEVTSPAGVSSAADSPKATRFDTRNTRAGDYRVRVGTNLMASNGISGKFRLKIWIR